MDENERLETRATTRRQFVKKAKYAWPAIYVLAAAPEIAWASAPASGTCLVSGANCNVDEDCCTLDCNPGMMCESEP